MAYALFEYEATKLNWYALAVAILADVPADEACRRMGVPYDKNPGRNPQEKQKIIESCIRLLKQGEYLQEVAQKHFLDIEQLKRWLTAAGYNWKAYKLRPLGHSTEYAAELLAKGIPLNRIASTTHVAQATLIKRLTKAGYSDLLEEWGY